MSVAPLGTRITAGHGPLPESRHTVPSGIVAVACQHIGAL